MAIEKTNFCSKEMYDFLSTPTNLIIKTINTDAELKKSIVENIYISTTLMKSPHVDNVIISRILYHIFTDYLTEQFDGSVIQSDLLSWIAEYIDWYKVAQVTNILTEVSEMLNSYNG